MTKALTTSTAQLAVPKELQRFLKENASVGSENLGGASLPQLKVHEATSKNKTEDGQYCKTGTFFYSPDRTSHEELTVSIMIISRGFRTLDTDENGQPKRKKSGELDIRFNQFVGGMILETQQPFIMFVGGTRLQKLWDFRDVIRPFTKGKQAVPMFSLKVKLTLEEIETNFGRSYVVNYELIKEGDMLQIIADMDMLQLLRSGVDLLKDKMTDFIETNEVDRETGQPIKQEDKFIHESVAQVSGNDVPESLASTEEAEPEEADLTGDDDISDEIPF